MTLPAQILSALSDIPQATEAACERAAAWITGWRDLSAAREALLTDYAAEDPTTRYLVGVYADRVLPVVPVQIDPALAAYFEPERLYVRIVRTTDGCTMAGRPVADEAEARAFAAERGAVFAVAMALEEAA